MLLAVHNFNSGKSGTQYKIEDKDGNEIVAFTSTNVRERHIVPIVESTTTGTATNKLIDASQDFTALGIQANQHIYNKTDNTVATVTAVDNATTLSISADIMVASDDYSITYENGKSVYYVDVADGTFVNADGTEFEGHILWKTTDTPPQMAAETIDKMQNDLFTTASVVTDGSNSASTFKTDLTQATDDYWLNTWIRFTSGSLIGQIQKVSAYNGTTKFLTMSSAFTGTPSSGDTFIIINR